MSPRVLVTVFAISLMSLGGCSREKSDWRSAQAADTLESYQQFITEHPESELVTSARERLAQLTEDKDWRTAAGIDSLPAYQQFLAQHPAGRWAKEAQIRIDNFSSGTGAGAPASASPSTTSGVPAAGEGAQIPSSGTPQASGSAAFGVQLGAFSSAERANAEWTRLQGEAKGLLDGLAPRVVVGEANGRPIYRLQAEVRDEIQARAVCGGLKQSGKGCVVVHP